ncbi:MAG: RpiR family transcriptional regulator [Hyphomicrobiales bacterium]|uniref:MurR/RpiR family transcriptional regulator n=1 Tax=Aestuariivirga sp. TaxID=2650926 RepID=UPI0035AD830C
MVRRLRASARDGSGAGAAIASYMLANLQGLPFETAATLGEKIGVSEASIGRYCRALGYRHLKELKGSLRAQFGNTAWLIGDRLKEFHARSKRGSGELALALERELAAVVGVYELATTAAFNRWVARLSHCPTVHVAGFQTERGHAVQLVHNLQYVRPGVQLADVAGGHFSEILLAEPKSVCLVLFDGRRYSRTTQLLAEAAARRGIAVTLITDPYCDWAHGVVSELFTVETDLNHFWDTTSAMASLVGLAVNGVFKELGAGVEGRMEQVAGLYNDLVGHTGFAPSGTLARRARRTASK